VTGEPSRDVAVAEIELIRACWFEALDFFSDNGFETRTGSAKDEAAGASGAFRADRRAATMTRQSGEI
jgi:hypothetical protein